MTSEGASVAETALGPVPMDGELPARHAISSLFDQMDFQQATQTYLWALPLVSSAQWKHVHEHEFGAKNGDLVYYRSFEDKLGILGGNATTPYLVSILDLSKSGPMVVELPHKEISGLLSDFWQRSIGIIGVSADKNAGERFLILPPGAKPVDAVPGYMILTSTTMNVTLGFRVLESDEKKAFAQVKKVKVYPFSQRNNPIITNVLTPNGRKYYVGQPRGIEYWELLHAIIQDEPVEERDRFFMAMLHNLGIEKGKPLDLTERQRKILIQGAETGELFAKANTFAKRFGHLQHWPDRQWKNVATMDNDIQRVENHDQLNERSSYFYEAILFSKGSLMKAPSMVQVFIGTSTDGQGRWLEGSKMYTLLLAPNPPAKVYWSISIYNVATRTLIENEQKRADIFSKRDDIVLNEDGSITIYFGPEEPKGLKKNWLQTIRGKHWLVYLRLFYPLEPFFDKTWKMGDIEELQ